MTDGQAAAWAEHGEKYLIEPPRGVSRESIVPGWTLDGGGLPSGNKFVVEIGTGRGENIVSAAGREPETNFLGVEVYGPGLARAILLAEGGLPAATAAPLVQPGGLPNLRLIQADAPELLDALPEHQVDELWVFFPDPWPKSRHLKRRLIDNHFTAQVSRVLKPGAIIRLATDWEHYAQQMQAVFTASSDFEPLADSSAGVTERFVGRVLTAFESKGIREGRQITDLAFRRL